ncbi:MAG: sulfatase-like hydrolase/transferase [Kiritimatiellia bacterium]
MNILLITTDQQSGNAMSCAGNPHLRTPSMDRLAHNGVRFDGAYCSYPLCVPARMSFFTSRMPHELGIYVNTQETDEPCPAPMLGARLRDAGYHCHYVGKWHLTVPEKNSDEHGFREIVFGGGYGGPDGNKAAEAVKFLNRRHKDPFFLVVSFNNPHDCCELARGESMRMAPLPDLPPDNELPPLPVNFESVPAEPEALRDFQRNFPRVGRAQDWNEIETRRYRWGYNRLVEMADAETGKVLDALESNGLWDDTLIIFLSDHGDGQGAHRWNQKWCMYDEVSRVPFIVKAPGRPAPGRVNKRVVSASLDIFPTICDYTGIAAPGAIRGQSVRPHVENRAVGTERKFAASESSFGNWGPLREDKWPKSRMIRSDQFKYVAYDTGNFREQFFDMQNDPHETENLSNNAKYSDILDEHRGYLGKWLEETRDSFDMPDAGRAQRD